MTLINDAFCTLRLDPLRPIPIEPVEPEDFIHDLSGNILCTTDDYERDRIAGRFRVYYADFELAENHGVSAFEVLDAYQHTFDYAEAILGSDERPFSRRLYRLLEDEIWNSNFLILDAPTN